MGEVFKGWKRKTGVVTLVSSCYLLAMWFEELYLSQNQVPAEALAETGIIVGLWTFISAWLLLSKSRKPRPPQTGSQD
jgi:hypothetical protein